MLYSVKQMAEMANVTIKTLYHYHKIGLLYPYKVTEAGYRLYGRKELERLQEILFYRELEFPLKDIKQMLDGDADRLTVLNEQKKLFLAKQKRMQQLIQTLEESIRHTRKGEAMDQSKMFKGFSSRKEWEDALKEQNQYLQETYDYDVLTEKPVNVEEMNEKAAEASRFMSGMADALRSGLKHDHRQVRESIKRHIGFLGITAADFKMQARFFVEDDFHRSVLENEQTGLSYYMLAAAEAFAA
ncbi:MerR family transcriptional regulator [Bacillus glycinifermentans]|uniref:MerR family transcriptional regulator n=1 Tax=Bacillus glycinifermentans TaxID=1664069 RepID=UPI001FF37569|nr:MerR family transcriptional regulator [Bacillus glycinifermentans]MEC0494458.1 MerR family transcriptional regulator [Bacillus glycinifermentans]MEC0539788.1 MerR family transcriptional regulator [Bacillus glycinifermentans]UOY87863.1 MerR family transcriptional regulator [Bacillus glycinifermentans]